MSQQDPPNNPPYPPQAGFPQPQQGQPSYPQAQPGYPQAQSGQYPQQPQQGYPQPYPQAQPGYPQQPGYPPQGQPGYPPQGQPGFAPQPPMYPPANFTPRHKLPGVAVAASIIWIIYGSLALIGNLIGLAGSGGRAGTPSFIGLGIAVGFLVGGIQTLMGKAKGMLGNGIASIVLGALVAIAFLLLGALIRGFHAPMILILIGVLFGALLITAGVLGCIGNKAYKEYRMTKGLPQ
jgi:hypothetical protein